jgi:hypothetical protein
MPDSGLAPGKKKPTREVGQEEERYGWYCRITIDGI